MEVCELQARQGTTQLSGQELAQKTGELDEVWKKLTPRARAQVFRFGRQIATSDDLGEKLVVGPADWLKYSTVSSWQKKELRQVVGDITHNMMVASRRGGMEAYTERVAKLNARLTTQATGELNEFVKKLGKGAQGIEDGIDVFSIDPQKQAEARAGLDEIFAGSQELVKQVTIISKTDLRTSPGMVDELVKVVDLAETVVKQADAIVDETGVRGNLAAMGGTESLTARAFFNRREVMVGVEKGTPFDTATIHLAAALEYASAIGFLEKSLTFDLGHVIRIDLDGLVDMIPFARGLRHARQVMVARANEQLEAVDSFSHESIKTEVGREVETVQNVTTNLADKSRALRNLKRIGSMMARLADWRGDATRMASTDYADRHMTPEMKAARAKLRTASEHVVARLTAVETASRKPSERSVNGVGRMAVQAAERLLGPDELNMAGDAEKLFTQKGYKDWIVQAQKGGLGKWVREKFSVWMGRSPTKLTGIELTGPGEYVASGVGLAVAEGVSAMERMVNSNDTLVGAVANSELASRMPVGIALFMNRLGLGEKTEVLRAMFTKEGASFGHGSLGAEFATAKVLNFDPHLNIHIPVINKNLRLGLGQFESMVGRVVAGKAFETFVWPFMLVGGAIAGEALQKFAAANEIIAKLKLEGVTQVLEALKSRTVDIGGPDVPGADQAGKVMSDWAEYGRWLGNQEYGAAKIWHGAWEKIYDFSASAGDWTHDVALRWALGAANRAYDGAVNQLLGIVEGTIALAATTSVIKKVGGGAVSGATGLVNRFRRSPQTP